MFTELVLKKIMGKPENFNELKAVNEKKVMK